MKKMRELNILLAEDNLDHAELTIDALRQIGVKNDITHVHDGEAALDYMRREGLYKNRGQDDPNLILLDINMPKKDGLAVLKELKDDPRFRKTPIIMLTTSTRETEINRAYETGAVSFVSKPIEFESFAKKIADFNIYWVMVAEIPT